MKTKDIRIGLLLLMASMNSVARSPIENVEKAGADYGWMALVLHAMIGALSILHWLRIFLKVPKHDRPLREECGHSGSGDHELPAWKSPGVTNRLK